MSKYPELNEIRYIIKRKENQPTKEEVKRHQQRKAIDLMMRSNRPIQFKK